MNYQQALGASYAVPRQVTSATHEAVVTSATLDTPLFVLNESDELRRPKTLTSRARRVVTVIALLISVSNPAWAGTVSPVQSTDRPFDLDIAGQVQLAGSDEQAADFQQNDLAVIQDTVSESLSETQAVSDPSSITLDPNKLLLDAEADVRVYFIGEGAGYHNTLGYYTGDPAAISSGINNTDAQLIFPDASSSTSYLGDTTNATRTESAPLLAGDFVDLGTQDAGTQLNFFLIGNGANGGTNIYTADPALNPDGTEHFVSLAVTAVADSPYLLIGVEDLYGGGDRDYNDLVFAVDIGYENVQSLIAATVPLPAGAVAVIGLLGFVGFSRLRARRRTTAA